MNASVVPRFIVYRRLLGAIGSVLAGLAVALSAYAMHAASPEAQLRLDTYHGYFLRPQYHFARTDAQRFAHGRPSPVAQQRQKAEHAGRLHQQNQRDDPPYLCVER